MTDTQDYIYKKQFEIFFAKSLRERFLMNMELTEFVRETTKRRIKRLYPQLNEIEIKKEIFRQMYADIFSKDEMNEIFETWNKIEKLNII